MKHRTILLLLGIVFFTVVAGIAYAASPASPGMSGILYTKPVKAVLFNHQTHIKNTCLQCHSGLFDMKALKAQEKKDFVMDALYKGKYCGACHNGKLAFASDTQCARCHVRIDSGQETASKDVMPNFTRVNAMGKGDASVRFRHDLHEKHASCIQCHPKPFVVKRGASPKITYADHAAKKACFACHDGAKSFSFNDCNRCHIKATAPKAALVIGKSSKAVPFRHDSHRGKLSCKSCHTGLFSYKKGETKVTFADHSGKKSCFTCHNGAKDASFYTCKGCHKETGTAQGKTAVKRPQGPQAGLVYEMKGAGPVQFNHPSHTAFECKVCHPEPFAMQKGKTKMTMAQMYQGQSCGICHNGKKAFKSFDCAKCHK